MPYPSASSASGIWSLEDARRAKADGNWPALNGLPADFPSFEEIMALDGGEERGRFFVRDKTTPQNNVSNGVLDDLIVQGSTSPKKVRNAAGKLVWSPHNFCLHSEDKTDASWVKAGIGTPVDTHYRDVDGRPLQRIPVSATTGSHWLYQQNNPAIEGETYTRGFKARPDGIYSKIMVQMYFGAGAGKRSTFTLTGDGSKVDAGGGVGVISRDTDGTYDIALTAESNGTSLRVDIFVINDADETSFTGDGTSGFLIGGEIVCRGVEKVSYLKTTDAIRVGVAQEWDEAVQAYVLMSEPEATNILLASAALSTQSVLVTAEAHTLSFFGTGTVALSGVSTAGPVVGTGADDRVTLTFTPSAGSLALTVSGSVERAQLETGAVATSYIPTFGTTVMRGADDLTIAVSDLPHSATEGTLFIRGKVRGPGHLLSLESGTAEQIRFDYAAGVQIQTTFRDGNVEVAQFSGGAVTAGDEFAAALAWGVDDVALSVNSATAVTANNTGGGLPTATRLKIGGSAFGAQVHLATLDCRYLPERLSNADLEALI